MRYMLDTNIVSHIIKGKDKNLLEHLSSIPMREISISSITEAELFYGLAKCGYPDGLHKRIREFISRVDVLSWDSSVATIYGNLRTSCETIGISLSDMDMLIAAHAVSIGATLITRDQAFSKIPKGLTINSWDNSI
jgi:tRNA(fMet)-specific endonuclease VapC